MRRTSRRSTGMHWIGKGPHRRPQKRLDKRLEGVAKAVGGGCCRLQMPALGDKETVAGRRLGALEGWYLPAFQFIHAGGVRPQQRH